MDELLCVTQAVAELRQHPILERRKWKSGEPAVSNPVSCSSMGWPVQMAHSFRMSLTTPEPI